MQSPQRGEGVWPRVSEANPWCAVSCSRRPGRGEGDAFLRPAGAGIGISVAVHGFTSFTRGYSPWPLSGPQMW